MKHKIFYLKEINSILFIEDQNFGMIKKAEKILKEKKGYDNLLDSYNNLKEKLMNYMTF